MTGGDEPVVDESDGVAADGDESDGVAADGDESDGVAADGDENESESTDDDNHRAAHPDLELVLIAAVGENRVIGRDGGMPWHFSEDLKHFKRTTTGHPVIVGRKTFETVVAGLGEPFPGRTSVVLTSQSLDLPDGAVLANSVEEAIDEAAADAAERGVDTAYVAGGGRVYEQFLPFADRLVLTEIHDAYDGDTRFPAWDDESWDEVERDAHEAFDFVTYERTDC